MDGKIQPDPVLTPYMQNLQADPKQFQSMIEKLLEKYRVQPVGNGFIDLIIDCAGSLQLIDEFAGQAVAVERVTWWCHCTPQSKLAWGCPHGMGGPTNEFGEGYFAECTGYPDFVLAKQPDRPDELTLHPAAFAGQSAQLTKNYIQNVLPQAAFYTPCLHPGLWLQVPADWKREHYLLER